MSSTVIRKLKAHFARQGIPDVVFSDNGPQYSSRMFKKFSQNWEFTHITSSPGYPQSNGKAESAVKTAKRLMRKAKMSGQDPYLAILDHRNTPTQGLNASPAQRLLSRRTRTLLPITESFEAKSDRHQSTTHTEPTKAGKVLQSNCTGHGHTKSWGLCASSATGTQHNLEES